MTSTPIKYAAQQGKLHFNATGNTVFATRLYKDYLALAGLRDTSTRERRFVAAFLDAAAKENDARLAAAERVSRR